ncbi:MAG: hypothetical protein AAF692_02230 [Pseudomonadota bacterium]
MGDSLGYPGVGTGDEAFAAFDRLPSDQSFLSPRKEGRCGIAAGLYRLTPTGP